MTANTARINQDQDPRQIVDHLTQVAIRLDEVLNSETQSLNEQKLGQIIDFHEEKTRLTNEFALHVNIIEKTPYLIDRAPADRVTALRSAITTLHTHSEKNGKLLLAAKSVSDGIIQTVAKVASQKRSPQTGYGRSGAMAETPLKSTPLSLDAQV